MNNIYMYNYAYLSYMYGYPVCILVYTCKNSISDLKHDYMCLGMYMPVYMYVLVCVYMCVYIYIYIYIYIYMCVYIYIYMCVYIWAYIRCSDVIARSILSQIFTKDSPGLARQSEVWESFVVPASNWCSASVPVNIYVIFYNAGQRYNDGRLYGYKFTEWKGHYSILNSSSFGDTRSGK